MSQETLITLISLGVPVVVGLITFLVALFRGEIKNFIIKKMEEAEQSGKSGKEKLAYVIEEVKKKYKIAELIINVKKFVEKIIELSKQINAK